MAGLMDDLLALVTAPLPEQPPEMRALLPAYENGLARLDALRATGAADIDRLTAERRKLLLDASPAATARIREIDQKTDGLNLDLERGDEIELRLIAGCRYLSAGVKGDEANQIGEMYAAAVRIFCSRMRDVVEAREGLVAVRDLVVRLGLEARLGQLEMPVNPFPADLHAVDTFERGASGTAAQFKTLPTRGELFPVRFTASWDIYHAGDIAGFAAERAWALVDRGIATWANPTRRPPKPAMRRPAQ